MVDENKFEFKALDEETIMSKAADMQEELDGMMSEIYSEFESKLGNTMTQLIAGVSSTLISYLIYGGRSFGELFGVMKGTMELGNQEAMEDLRPTLFQLSDLAELRRRDSISETKYQDQLTKWGFSPDKISDLSKLLKTNPGVSEIVNGVYKNCISEIDGIKKLKLLGFESEDAELILCSAKSLLDVDSLIRLWLRDDISEDELDARLKENGFPQRSINDLKKLAFFIPPVQDIIRMAVREVFSPEIRAKFQQDEDFPVEFKDTAKKQGISEEWAKNYWAAHWELPSILQGFEMLHRDVITKTELQMLLKALDVMPFWRDKLTAISYNPLTRVDVRRMFDLGVLDKTEVLRAYKDVGYNDKNADLMTDFTVEWVAKGDKELSKSEILKAWDDGLVTRSDVIQHLTDLEYPMDQINLLMLQREFEQVKELRKALIDSAKDRYVDGVIDVRNAEQELIIAGVLGTELLTYITKWNIKKRTKSKELSIDDLKEALTVGIINVDDFRTRLSLRGYSDVDINIMVKLLEGVKS